ncbi:MAG TPA: hypothetical protein PLW96_02815 [Bacteroidales bacterium]|nr:hypothetical protein [Bacteroidales bacterium]
MNRNKVGQISQYWNASFRQKESWYTRSVIIFFIVFFLGFLILTIIDVFDLGENNFYVNALESVISIGTFVIAASNITK